MFSEIHDDDDAVKLQTEQSYNREVSAELKGTVD